ncbi:MAG TPA: PAS domain-containing protein [Armatimonadota bacterium]|nr:PAS domain-containing protein [Armatimonadota bacterium]
MKVIAGLTRSGSEWNDLAALLRTMAAVLVHDSVDEIARQLGAIPPDLVLIDVRASRSDIQQLVEMAPPNCALISVAPHPPHEELGAWELEEDSRIHDTLRLTDTAARQQRVLERAIERTELLQRQALPITAATTQVREPTASRPSDHAWQQALRSLSRSLSAGFNPRELIEPFLDLSLEIAGVARVAVLTLDPGRTTFKVTASRGLYGPTMRWYPHPRHGGLASLLLQEGRPLRPDDASVRMAAGAADISRSFDVLQAKVCIPLATMGDLLAIMALGNRINGAPPADEHVEMLFTIGSHIAIALENTLLHAETARQKAQWENVLEHMTNGIAAINENGQVTVFNRRAAEILRLAPENVIGRDLRSLPSPLGDYLYGAMRTGQARRATSLSLPGSGAPIELTTYPLLLPESDQPVGSVLVVEDITERLALEDTRRHADRNEVLNRLVSQLAHEIRNPLTAVKTFADLFPQHHGDPDFTSFIAGTVLPEIGRLDETVGKLVDFVNHSSLEMEDCQLEPILRQLLDRISGDAEIEQVRLVASIDDDLPLVRADPVLVSKAISYLVRHLVLRGARQEGAEVRVQASWAGAPSSEVVVELSSSRPWITADELGQIFDPLFVQQDQLNLSLPVARKIIQEHRGDVEAVVGASGAVALRVTLQAASEAAAPPAAAPQPRARRAPVAG